MPHSLGLFGILCWLCPLCSPLELHAGGAGWALQFDGDNDFAQLLEVPPCDSLTIELWSRPSISASHEQWHGQGVVLSRHTPNGLFRFQQDGRLTLSSRRDSGVWTQPVHVPGGWNHWALVLNESQWTVYLSGELVSATPHVADDWQELCRPGPSLFPWLLGAAVSHPGSLSLQRGSLFAGQLDEVRLWRTALSEEEVRKWMFLIPGDQESGLLRRWGFDDLQGRGKDVVPQQDGQLYTGNPQSPMTPALVASGTRLVGGPIAVEATVGGPAVEVQVCAAVLPPTEGIAAAFAIEASTANSSAGLLGPEGESEADYGVAFAVALKVQSTGFSPDPVSILCSNIRFLPRAAAHEILPFRVVAQAPGNDLKVEPGWLDIVVHPSSRPIAGLATALSLDGSGYVSLGSLDLSLQQFDHSADSGLSFSLWVDPFEVVEDSYILSQHTTAHSRLLLFGFSRGRYHLWMSDGTTTEDEAFFPPSLEETYSGRTGAQVLQEKGEPHLLTVTIHCQPESPTHANTTARMYVDGYGIGEVKLDELNICWYHPSSTTGQGEVWLLGGAYRGRDFTGTANEAGQLQGATVEVVGLLGGVFEDLRVYTSVLSLEDVQALALGQSPQTQQENLLLRYTFDAETDSVCLDRQLLHLQDLHCSQLGLLQGDLDLIGRTVPQRGLHGGATFVDSPFSRVAGSALPKAIENGTCGDLQLLGSDLGSGKGLVFVLPTSLPGVSLQGNQLRLCASEIEVGETLEVPFDVCNHQGVCASEMSGLGSAVFKVFWPGPTITQLQHDRFNTPGSLRLLFSETLRAPELSLSNLGGFLDMTLPEGWTVREVHWEVPDILTEDKQVLRMYFNMPTGSWMHWWYHEHPPIAFRVRKEAMIQDLAGTSLFSTAVTPSRVVNIKCDQGETLPPNEAACQLCRPGWYAYSDPKQKGATSCRGCGWGEQQPLYGQLQCVLCPFGRYQTHSAIAECHHCEETLPGSTTIYEGSTNSFACVCPAGSAIVRAQKDGPPACQPCSEGLLCPGGREGANSSVLRRLYTDTGEYALQNRIDGWHDIPPHGRPTQAPGFSASQPEWEGAQPSFIVRCSSKKACPGGPLGSCPTLREGRACALCVAGSFEDGEVCRPCSERDSLMILAYPFMVALGASVGLLWLGAQRPTVFRQPRVSLAICASVAFSAMQVIGSLSGLGSSWPEPMRTLQSWLGIFVLSIDKQSPQCDLESFSSPVTSYITSLVVYPLLAALLTVALLGRRLFGSRVSLSQAINMHGVGLMALVTSISALGLAPFKCRSNPDGTSSPEAYRSVVCWEGRDHLTMVIGGVVTLTIEVLGFLALLFWATISYPTIIVQPGGGEHMVRFRFLFGHFTPNRYFFGLLFGLRKLFVALAPMAVVDLPQVQLVLVLLVVAGSMGLQCALWPWRTFTGNMVDGCVALFIMVVISAGFMIGGADADAGERFAQKMILAGLSAALALFVLVMFYCCQKLLVSRRYYRMFLSHHKVGAGLLARWVKLILRDFGLTRIFLDSDNLKQLDKLVDIVSYDCDNVVVLLTRETLTRPWCAMELAAAFKSGTRVVPVVCDGFDGISDEFLNGLPEVWTDDQQATMTSGGITLDVVRKAYESLRRQEAIHLERSGARVDVHLAVVRTIIARCSGTSGGDTAESAVANKEETKSMDVVASSSMPTPISGVMAIFSMVAKDGSHAKTLGSQGSGRSSKSKTSRVAILNDMSLDEPACGCRVIQIMLQELLQESVAVKSAYQDLNPCCVLVTLRPGVLRDLEAATSLVLASEDKAVMELTPLVIGDFAEFPTSAFWQELGQGQVFRHKDLVARNLSVARVERAYRRLFNTLAMRFSGHASTDIQTAEVSAMAVRLHTYLKKDQHRDRVSSTDSKAAHFSSAQSQAWAGEDCQRMSPEPQRPCLEEITQPLQVQHSAL